jgi:hypothetical protein
LQVPYGPFSIRYVELSSPISTTPGSSVVSLVESFATMRIPLSVHMTTLAVRHSLHWSCLEFVLGHRIDARLTVPELLPELQHGSYDSRHHRGLTERRAKDEETGVQQRRPNQVSRAARTGQPRLRPRKVKILARIGR